MTIRGLLRAGAASLVAAGIAFGTGSGYARVAAADYTRYHTYDELTAALRELAKDAPEAGEARRSREDARGPHGLGDRDRESRRARRSPSVRRC